jgi:hypothetical protein
LRKGIGKKAKDTETITPDISVQQLDIFAE